MSEPPLLGLFRRQASLIYQWRRHRPCHHRVEVNACVPCNAGVFGIQVKISTDPQEKVPGMGRNMHLRTPRRSVLRRHRKYFTVARMNRTSACKVSRFRWWILAAVAVLVLGQALVSGHIHADLLDSDECCICKHSGDQGKKLSMRPHNHPFQPNSSAMRSFSR